MSKNSTHVSLPDDDYAALKALADEEDRTIPEQARHMLRAALHPSAFAERATGTGAPFDLSTRRRVCCSTLETDPHGAQCVRRGVAEGIQEFAAEARLCADASDTRPATHAPEDLAAKRDAYGLPPKEPLPG